MRDYKGNELRLGDRVLTITNLGTRILYEGVIVRMTPSNAEVREDNMSYGHLKSSSQIMKLG